MPRLDPCMRHRHASVTVERVGRRGERTLASNEPSWKSSNSQGILQFRYSDIVHPGSSIQQAGCFSETSFLRLSLGPVRARRPRHPLVSNETPRFVKGSRVMKIAVPISTRGSGPPPSPGPPPPSLGTPEALRMQKSLGTRESRGFSTVARSALTSSRAPEPRLPREPPRPEPVRAPRHRGSRTRSCRRCPACALSTASRRRRIPLCRSPCR